MCGIAGFFITDTINDKQKLSIFNIASKLFVETQSRGSDASGFSYINTYGNLVTVKGPVTAQKMILEDKWKKLKNEMPNSIIMHTRAWTTGTPLDNFNNHPIVVNKEISIVHNGVISNHVDLKDKYKLPNKGQVDSEVIPLLISHHINEITNNKPQNATTAEMIKAINLMSREVSGGFACAMLNKYMPKSLYLFVNNNPTAIAYCDELNVIFFASTSEILKNALNIEDLFDIKLKVFKIPKVHCSIQRIDTNTITVLKIKDKVSDISKDKFSIVGYELNENKFQTWRTWNASKNAYEDYSYDRNKNKEEQPLLKVKNIFTDKTNFTNGKEDWQKSVAYAEYC